MHRPARAGKEALAEVIVATTRLGNAEDIDTVCAGKFGLRPQCLSELAGERWPLIDNPNHVHSRAAGTRPLEAHSSATGRAQRDCTMTLPSVNWRSHSAVNGPRSQLSELPLDPVRAAKGP